MSGKNTGNTQQAKYISLAEGHVKDAEKVLNSWSFFASSNKKEDAAEHYENAAKKYILANKAKEAGDAFKQAATLYESVDIKFMAAKNYGEAGKCYQKDNLSNDALKALRKANDLETEPRLIAKHHELIGEVYKSEGRTKEAYEEFKIASNALAQEPANANKIRLKLAKMSAEHGDYQEALEMFELLASSSAENPLLRWSLKDYFMNAGLCHLVTGDYVETRSALERYKAMDVSFETTTEYDVLSSILEYVEQQDVDKFTAKVAEYYKRNTKVEDWVTTLLLKVKRSMMEDVPQVSYDNHNSADIKNNSANDEEDLC